MVDTALAARKPSILAAALTKAGLVDALNSDDTRATASPLAASLASASSVLSRAHPKVGRDSVMNAGATTKDGNGTGLAMAVGDLIIAGKAKKSVFGEKRAVN